MDILDKIKKHTGSFDSSRIRTLIYGESGSGKTVTASTWPNPLFLNIDDGLASVRLPVDDLKIRSWADLYEAVSWLLTTEHGYDTIVVDSLNEMQSLSMQHILQAFPGQRRSYDNQPTVGDYGKMINDVDKMIRALKSLDCHIVFLSQVVRKEHNTDVIKPGLIGKNTADLVCRMMDLVAYLYIGDGGKGAASRFLAFSMPEYVGKDRSGLLPQVLEVQNQDTTFNQLYKYWS